MGSGFMIALVVVALAAASGCGDSSPSSSSPAPATSAAGTPAPAPAPPPPATTTMMVTTTTSVPAGPRTLRRATFMGANGYVTDGGARIQRENDEFTLELEEDFRTSNSAALDVRLCTNSGCTGDNVSLGELQRFSGRQSYPLADSGTGYSHVSIYCTAVRLPFGSGRLQ